MTEGPKFTEPLHKLLNFLMLGQNYAFYWSTPLSDECASHFTTVLLGFFSTMQVYLYIILISALYFIVYNKKTNDAESSMQLLKVGWWYESKSDMIISYTVCGI